MGKTKAQTGMQTASYCNNTLQRTASKQLRIYTVSHEVPLLEALGHPSIAGKLLTNIASRFTLPKLHLATYNAIHWINLCAVDSAIGFPNVYQLDSNLSYPVFEQSEPELH